jgi:hypothetical protein
MRLPEGVDYGYKGGVPGLYDEKGRLVKKAEDLTAQQLSDFEADYKRRRGSRQIEADKQVQQLERQTQAKSREEAKKKAEAEAKAKSQTSATPATQPAAQPPAQPAAQPAATPSGTTPAPSPAAPKPSPVADYVKAAAAARKSGDPAEMAKVRDMGLKIWRDTPANKKLAAAAAERERIRGTAQTDNPLMKDMKSRLPLTPSVQAPAVKNLGSGQQSLSQNPNAAIAATPKPQVPPVTASKDATMNKAADELSKNPLGKKKEVKAEAYDIVLDYLLSEGHADTISEAHYVMLQMDSDHIQNIVEALRDIWTKPSAAERAQMQSPFAKPDKPLPSIPSPFAKPASRDDSGKLTTYGAGGGAAAERAGQTRAQVMQQGAKNLETRNKSNPGPNFGR